MSQHLDSVVQNIQGERLVPHFCALHTSNNLGQQSKDKYDLSCIYLCYSVHSFRKSLNLFLNLCIVSSGCVIQHGF